MASTPEHDTLICLFHHTDRAERTVQELLEIGIPENAITLIGRARMTADIDSGNASLDTINVPDADRKRLRDGLQAGGSIVAVSADSSMAGQIEEIFKEYSADKIDEKVLSTSDTFAANTGTAIDANAFPTTVTEERVDLPPVDRTVTLNPPVVETVTAGTQATLGTEPSDRFTESDIDDIIIVTEPPAGLAGGTQSVTTEETLVLLEPTDLVEDTNLVEPPSGSAFGSSASAAADRLNDPLNRR